MADTSIRIGVMAPGGRITPQLAAAVTALAAREAPGATLTFHPQCYLSHGHFAGPDEARAEAFLDLANDPEIDAVWFARGGYGAGRLLELVAPRLGPVAAAKTYLGYSDAGCLLAMLDTLGVGRVAHGPMPQDLMRAGGEAAVARAVRWLATGDASSLEPSLSPGQPVAAFNMAILSSLIGTPWQPPLAGRVLMLEEVSEHMYRIDRFLFHITSTPAVRQIAGLRLGRCSDVPPNDPDFGLDEEAVARAWCARAGLAWLGRADIGHDVGNRVVVFR